MQSSQHPFDQCICSEKVNISWDDVIGLEKQRNILQQNIEHSQSQQYGQSKSSQKIKKWLIHGVPGVGKTYLIKAVAFHSQCNYFKIYGHDLIISKTYQIWKLVQYLFKKAEEKRPSIVVIDEFQNFSCRMDQTQADRRTKMELIKQIQRASKDVTVVISSQRPWEIDQSILSKLQGRIHLTIPDEKNRLKYIENQLKTVPHLLSEQQMKDIALRSEGFTPADLTVLVRDSAMELIRRVQYANKFRKTGGGKWRACWEGEEGEQMELMQIESAELEVGEVTFKQFERSFERTRASIGKDIINHFNSWNEKHCEYFAVDL